MARGRIGTEIHVTGDRLLAVVARLGIVAEVVRMKPEIPAREYRLHIGGAEVLRELARERVREPNLAKSNEIGGLHEGCGDASIETRVLARLADRRRLIGSEAVAVVQRECLVLGDAALLHVDEHRERGRPIGKVVPE